MTALDIAPVIQGVNLADLEAADEVECQAIHDDDFVCSIEVRWSCPPYSCGCLGRRPVCQASHDLTFNHRWHYLACPRCGVSTLVSEWRKGWYPV